MREVERRKSESKRDSHRACEIVRKSQRLLRSLFAVIIFSGAMNADAWSAYLDFLCDKAIVKFTRRYIGAWTIGAPFSDQPDFVAVAVLVVLTIVVSCGAQCSSRVNSVFAFINIGVLLFVIVIGFTYSDLDNWTSKETGGFMPFGWAGVLKGSGACFWALTGFEVIAVSVEEARNPQRSVPLASALSIVIVTVLYVGTSAAMTLMSPYGSIDTEAPLPSVFANRGVTWGRYVVSIGPLLGLTTTLLTNSFSFVRLAYAIAKDGLLFSFFLRVNDCSQVPVWAVVVGTSASASIAFCLDLEEIVAFSVVLSLLQYILVAAAVIILRYQPPDHTRNAEDTQKHTSSDSEDESDVSDAKMDVTEFGDTENALLLRKRSGSNASSHDIVAQFHHGHPTPGSLRTSFHWLRPCLQLVPGPWVPIAIAMMCTCMTVLAILMLKTDLTVWWTWLLVMFLLLATAFLLLTIHAHQQNVGGTHLQVRRPTPTGGEQNKIGPAQHVQINLSMLAE